MSGIFFVNTSQQKTHFCMPTKVRFLNDVCLRQMMLASPHFMANIASLRCEAAQHHFEHSAIFYRTDKFTPIASDTRWLSSTPTKESLYSYTENGTTYKANNKRIMTYVVLERKSDGARFLIVNTHLDNNGDNTLAVAEKIRQGQIGVMMQQIQGVLNVRGNLPTVVLGDFNATPEKSARQTMLSNGYLDASAVAAQGGAASTYNGMSDTTSAILDYIFVSSNLANAVETYTVCPPKRNGQWISDHNAIVATITIPSP